VGCRDGEDRLSKEEGQEPVSCCYLMPCILSTATRVSPRDFLRLYLPSWRTWEREEGGCLRFIRGDEGTKDRILHSCVDGISTLRSPIDFFSEVLPLSPPSAPSQQPLPFLFSPNLATPFPSLLSSPLFHLCHRSSSSEKERPRRTKNNLSLQGRSSSFETLAVRSTPKPFERVRGRDEGY
jgi:hypothetical protein